MKLLAHLIRCVSGLNSFIGRVFSWLALAIVLVCFAVVTLRYVFATSFVWMQDLYIWLNGAMFTAVAGFALLRDDHVRVDMFYRHASMGRKALADLIGAILFLLPFTGVLIVYSSAFVQRSWRYTEASANVGGMPGLFILKSFIIAFAVLIALQGLAMIARSILVLSGRADMVPASFAYKTQDETHEAAV
ncbi:TRAP transporter small permease subunit [Roseibium aestuarii]|uniref:TRAP transporter small permease protein n=1 Tax=Roseibium aestuarii TaxID=2600299 RepID=A0ABW4JX56_9HYPH|nr:TRAP transporter small permease subunit [Roseibium aestuarii]